MNPATNPMSLAFFQAIGSPMIFNTVTIDQPGKNIAGALLGGWEAGLQGFPGADVWMIVGAIRVAPGDRKCRDRMDVANADMMAQLSSLADEPLAPDQVRYP